MPKSDRAPIPLAWLDIDALRKEIDDLSEKYRQIRDRLTLAKQILLAYQSFQAGHQVTLDEYKSVKVGTVGSAASKYAHRRKTKTGESTSTRSKRSDAFEPDLLQGALLAQSPYSGAKQTRADLFLEVLRENSEQPLYYKQIYDIIRQKDPSIRWKNPASHLRTLIASMRKKGDDRIKSLGQGFYQIVEEEIVDQNKDGARE